jgi:hypothetical protein
MTSSFEEMAGCPLTLADAMAGNFSDLAGPIAGARNKEIDRSAQQVNDREVVWQG